MKHFFQRTAAVLLGTTIVAGTTAAAYAHWVERRRVGLGFYTVAVNRSEATESLPQGGLTILHLSDFHFRLADDVQAARTARLERLLAGRRYDILALTGDLIHDEAGLQAALEFLHRLQPRLGAYSVPGNRDYWKSSFRAMFGSPGELEGLTFIERLSHIARNVRRTLYRFTHNERTRLRVHCNDVPAMHAALTAQGIQPLLNRAVKVPGDGQVWIAGVDQYGGSQHMGGSDVSASDVDPGVALGEVPEDAILVLLAHSPDVWLHPASRRADLILAGHTHGGQIVAPGAGALYRQGTHLHRKKAAGWFEQDRTIMFVTRGIGESFPFRFGAPPEAALIRLVPGATRKGGDGSATGVSPLPGGQREAST